MPRVKKSDNGETADVRLQALVVEIEYALGLLSVGKVDRAIEVLARVKGELE